MSPTVLYLFELALFAASPLFGLAVGVAALKLYRRRIRRYEASFDRAYSSRFAARAAVAKTLHISLARTLQRSKHAVDMARNSSRDSAATQAALTRISDLLNQAAGESDRALRSLERAKKNAGLRKDE